MHHSNDFDRRRSGRNVRARRGGRRKRGLSSQRGPRLASGARCGSFRAPLGNWTAHRPIEISLTRALCEASESGGSEMIANRSVPTDTVLPHVMYQNLSDAIAWLSKVFGCSEHYRYGDPLSGAQVQLG